MNCIIGDEKIQWRLVVLLDDNLALNGKCLVRMRASYFFQLLQVLPVRFF
jgi:hypothetical protein